jgi:hypothetical protein
VICVSRSLVGVDRQTPDFAEWRAFNVRIVMR